MFGLENQTDRKFKEKNRDLEELERRLSFDIIPFIKKFFEKKACSMQDKKMCQHFCHYLK